MLDVDSLREGISDHLDLRVMEDDPDSFLAISNDTYNPSLNSKMIVFNGKTSFLIYTNETKVTFRTDFVKKVKLEKSKTSWNSMSRVSAYTLTTNSKRIRRELAYSLVNSQVSLQDQTNLGSKMGKRYMYKYD